MIQGKTEPRIWTKPLKKLTRANSLGFAFNDFCDALGVDLLPWQKWLAIHALETVTEGRQWRFRYRYVLILVSRQNGKTFFEVMLNIGLSIWWVRYWGVYGVVGATAAASFTFIIVMLADYNRKYDCVLSIKEIFSYWNIIVGTIIVMITMRYFSMLPINSALLSFVCKTAMAFLVFYLSLIITGEPSFIYVLQKAMQIIKRKTGK